MGNEPRKNLRVIYDGRCPFCVQVLSLVEKLDTFRQLGFYDSHDRRVLAREFPMVTPEETEEAMIALTARNEVFKGFAAFRLLVLRIPWLWLLAPLMYFPGSLYFGTRLYSWVARNRRSLGCRI